MDQLQQILHDLHINGADLLVNIAGFLVVWWILARFVFGPVREIKAAREKEVADHLEAAEQQRHQMQAMRQEYEQRLALIEQEARDRIEEATRQAHLARDHILADARAQADRLISRGHAEIAREREKAMVELRDQVVDLAIDAAESVLRASLDEARHRQLARDFLDELEKSKC
jgi:F-type H+-transporting ATPase subunit b